MILTFHPLSRTERRPLLRIKNAIAKADTITPMSTQRLFFAIWPDEAVQTRLRAAARELVSPGARAVAPDTVHLTLLFIGSADAARRACLEQAADGVKGSALGVVGLRTIVSTYRLPPAYPGFLC